MLCRADYSIGDPQNQTSPSPHPKAMEKVHSMGSRVLNPSEAWFECHLRSQAQYTREHQLYYRNKDDKMKMPQHQHFLNTKRSSRLLLTLLFIHCLPMFCSEVTVLSNQLPNCFYAS